MIRLYPASILDVAKDWRAALWVGLCWLSRRDRAAEWGGLWDE